MECRDKKYFRKGDENSVEYNFINLIKKYVILHLLSNKSIVNNYWFDFKRMVIFTSKIE